MRLTSIFRNIVLLAAGTAACYGQAVPVGERAMPSGYGHLPMNFEANRGQAGADVKFVARAKGYTVSLRTGGIALSLRPQSAAQLPLATRNTGSPTLPKTMLTLTLIGASQSAQVVGEDLQPGKVNYFIGNNPSGWRTNVPTYSRIREKNVYPGIDLVYYGNQSQLEYDFELSPGSNPESIRLEINGARRTTVDANGDLVLATAYGNLILKVPLIYQTVAGKRVRVDGTYTLEDPTHVAFHVAEYDRNQSLVIDPVLLYSTDLGGSGNDTPRSVAVDVDGNVYIAGYTDSGDFPLGTLGALSNGSPHVFVAKLDPTGSNLIYADYIGGNSQDFGYALALDAAKNVYITGSTASSDFPVVNAFEGTYPGAFNAFLTKISSSGASLLYSTYLGGNGSDVPSSLALDGSGNILVAGYTSSTNFPTSNAYQPAVFPNQGGMYGNYGFVTKFIPDGSALAFSTYLAGSSNVPFDCGSPCWPQPNTTITGMAVDGSGNTLIGGTTNTYDFPTTAGAYLTTDTTALNGTVGFVSKLNSTGSLQFSTYFYESSGLLTSINAVAVDTSGSAYAAGIAFSDGTFPLTSTSICDPAVYGWSCSYGFVTKFDPTGSSLAYSTFLGPNNFLNPISVLVDSSNDAYVLGTTASSSFTTISPLENYTSGNDLLLIKIDATANSETWATYLGGMLDDDAASMAADSSGNLYVAGSTNSTDFPTTQGAFQGMLDGNSDAFVAKIAPASAPAVSMSPNTLQFPLQQAGTSSQSQPVLLRNMGSSPLTISSIATSGDFAQTNTCGTSVSAAGNCSFSVTFNPTVAGHRTGSIILADDAAGSPHVINLSGDASTGASIGLNPTGVTFPNVQLGSSSSVQTVTVSSNGPGALHITSIQVSGDFSQTNTCGSTLVSGSSCSIKLTFTPTQSGNRSGTLSISDDAISSPQAVALSGAGSDFAIVSAPTSNTIKSGSNATYVLTVSALGGSFTSAVQLSCSGLPSKATCNFSPASVTPTGNQGTSTLTIGTTSASAALGPGPHSKARLFYALWLQLPGLGLFGMVFASGTGKKVDRKLRWLLLALLFASLLLMTACAGGTGISNPGGSGTPSGTYTVTVKGSSGTLQHSLPLTLIVQ